MGEQGVVVNAILTVGLDGDRRDPEKGDAIGKPHLRTAEPVENFLR